MRKIIENQLKFGQVDISSIEFDLHSQDEIPQLLGILFMNSINYMHCRC
jgi:hypothetical protein